MPVAQPDRAVKNFNMLQSSGQMILTKIVEQNLPVTMQKLRWQSSPKKQYEARIDPQLWQRHQSIIMQYYEHHTLEETVKWMEENLRFSVSKAQLRKQLHAKWGMAKYRNRNATKAVGPASEQVSQSLGKTDCVVSKDGNDPTVEIEGLPQGCPDAISQRDTYERSARSVRKLEDDDESTAYTAGVGSVDLDELPCSITWSLPCIPATLGSMDIVGDDVPEWPQQCVGKAHIEAQQSLEPFAESMCHQAMGCTGVFSLFTTSGDAEQTSIAPSTILLQEIEETDRDWWRRSSLISLYGVGDVFQSPAEASAHLAPPLERTNSASFREFRECYERTFHGHIGTPVLANAGMDDVYGTLPMSICLDAAASEGSNECSSESIVNHEAQSRLEWYTAYIKHLFGRSISGASAAPKRGPQKFMGALRNALRRSMKPMKSILVFKTGRQG